MSHLTFKLFRIIGSQIIWVDGIGKVMIKDDWKTGRIWAYRWTP